MFDKYEEKEVGFKEANLLVSTKQAKFVRLLDTKDEEGSRVIIRVKKVKSKPAQEAPTQEEVKRETVKGRIAYEIVRETDTRSTTVRKGKINAKKSFLSKKIDGIGRQFYADHIIKETKDGKTRYFVRWTLKHSEAYDINGDIKYDANLENDLLNGMMDDIGNAIGAAVGLMLERPMIYVLIIAFFLGGPIGLSYNDLFHLVPKTVVHWVPHA